uniref:Uncharacterized protein n=1 Tax=Trichuris muris TaxID=70415 RepID=A0A5S6R4S1_TRIMR
MSDQNVPGTDADKAVINLSSTVLSSVEKCVLSKGLNFVPTLREPPILDIISSAEHSLSKTDPTKAAEIKGAISGCLMQRHRVAPNTNNLERKVLRNLRNNKDLLVTKADKGNVIALLNQEDYVTKINSLLDGDVYRPLRSDPTRRKTRYKTFHFQQLLKVRIVPSDRFSLPLVQLMRRCIGLDFAPLSGPSGDDASRKIRDERSLCPCAIHYLSSYFPSSCSTETVHCAHRFWSAAA